MAIDDRHDQTPKESAAAPERRSFVKDSLMFATAAVAAGSSTAYAQEKGGKAEKPPALLVQKVSTGDVIVFDKARRELVIIDQRYVPEWDKTDKSWRSAMDFVKTSKGQQFDKRALQKIQAALAGIIFLG
jgi:hypothetical protein